MVVINALTSNCCQKHCCSYRLVFFNNLQGNMNHERLCCNFKSNKSSLLLYLKGLTYLFKNLASDRVNKTHARTVNDHVMHISEVFTAGFYTSITWPNTAPVALEIRCATSLTQVSRRTVTNRHWYAYVFTSASGGSHGRLGVNMAVGPTEQSVLALK